MICTLFYKLKIVHGTIWIPRSIQQQVAKVCLLFFKGKYKTYMK